MIISARIKNFFDKSVQSYKFFQFFRKSGVVNSISEKKNYFTAYQNNLIQYKNGDFLLNLSRVISFSLFHKVRCLNSINEVLA